MSRKSLIGAVLGVVLLLWFLLLPPIKPLTPLGMKAVGIFLFTITWWATVGIGYPSIISIVLFILTGIMTAQGAFAASWGSWLVLFLIGAFGLSDGLRVSGFSRRFALWFATRPFTAGRPWLMVGMFLLGCNLLGMVVTSVVGTIVFMAIAEPMLEAMGYKKGDAFAAMLIMGIGWAGTASSVFTPFAHPVNILMIDFIQRDFGYSISFLQWITFGVPTGLIGFLVLMGVYRYVLRPDVSRIGGMTTNNYLSEQASKLGPMKLEEKLAVGVLLGAVVCWMLPGIPVNILPEFKDYIHRMGYAVPALAGASLLCIIQVRKHPISTFRTWMVEGVEWGSVSLCAAIMAIGKVIGNPDTGIPELMTTVFLPLAQSLPFYALLFISVLWVVLQTNLMSNIVSATLVYTIMVPIVVAMGVGNPIAMGATLAAASYYAFSLPSATGSTAVVAGSGWVPVPFMARYGFVLIIPIALMFTFVCYPIAAVVFS